MSVLFVADRSFNNFDLLARAFAVAVETEIGNGSIFIHVAPFDNKRLGDQLIQLADIANGFQSKNPILVKRDEDELPTFPNLVVAFTPLAYYPYKARVQVAKADEAVTVLEY